MKTKSASSIRGLTAMVFALVLPLSGGAFASAWSYGEQTDKMDGSLTKFARLESDNSMALAPPYSGKNHARLLVRQRKADGLNVIFSIDKGQLICAYGEGCAVMVRFDDAQPVRFSATKPNDHSSTSLFLNNEKRFVDLARKAKQIRIAATVYQAGTQVLEFSSPAPLTWDDAKPSAAPANAAPKQGSQDARTAQEQMIACNASAGNRSGDDRKNFMMDCLKARK